MTWRTLERAVLVLVTAGLVVLGVYVVAFQVFDVLVAQLERPVTVSLLAALAGLLVMSWRDELRPR